MLQQRLYIPFKWALFLSFADVMCFFISVYLLIRVSEKCQNILFLLLKRREKQDFHRYGIPSNFSFPKQSFVEPHTVFQKFTSIIESFILYFFVSFFGVILVSWIYIASLLTSCKSSIRVPFLVSFLVSYSPFLVSSFAS